MVFSLACSARPVLRLEAITFTHLEMSFLFAWQVPLSVSASPSHLSPTFVGKRKGSERAAGDSSPPRQARGRGGSAKPRRRGGLLYARCSSAKQVV